MRKIVIWCVALVLGGMQIAVAQASPVAATPAGSKQVYCFGVGGDAGGIHVKPDDHYDPARGWGFDSSKDLSPIIERPTSCTSDKPFYFAVREPEGNYRVSVVLGDSDDASDATIKGQCRTLFAMNVKTAAGSTTTETFNVNVRVPQIAGGGQVKVNSRELEGEKSHWDDRILLEINGPRPRLQRIEIQPVSGVTTVYIAGDSTVCDQPNEPWSGWGMILPSFFDSRVSVANYAEAGRALFSFKAERRLDKILSVIKPGDYLFIQFGHNDQKDKRPGAGAFTTYKSELEEYVKAAQAKGATPVLVTPMYRRRFDAAGKLQESLGDYPAAMRQVASEINVPLIDLHAMSGQFFQTLGEQGTLKAFVHYPANTFPGQKEALKDDTHFNAYGAYELARCVANGIRAAKLPLAAMLKPDIHPFDPTNPDAPEAVTIAPSPFATSTKPQGS